MSNCEGEKWEREGESGRCVVKNKIKNKRNCERVNGNRRVVDHLKCCDSEGIDNTNTK